MGIQQLAHSVCCHARIHHLHPMSCPFWISFKYRTWWRWCRRVTTPNGLFGKQQSFKSAELIALKSIRIYIERYNTDTLRVNKSKFGVNMVSTILRWRS